MSSRGVGEVLERLRAALDELAARVDTLSDAGTLDALRGLRPVLCRAQAVQTTLIGAAHRRGAAGLDGAVSTQAWLRCRLRMGDAGAQVRVAVALSGLPRVAACYARGEISAEHVREVVDVARDIAPQVLAAGADTLLARQAVALAPGAARQAAERIRDHFDPQAAGRRAARMFGERWLSVATTFGGAVSIQGVLDPEGGAQVAATLAALTPPPVAGDQRSGGARRAEALVQACRLAAATSAAAVPASPQRPHVTVTIDWDSLRTQTPTPHGDLHPATVRRLACDAGVIPAVLAGAGEPLDLGRATRVVPAGMRRALILRDGCCRFPGCDRPATWTDAHHLRHWADGGPTALHNLLLLCRAHHGAVHEGGWSLALDPATASITATRPDGTPHDLTSRPRGQPPWGG